VSVIVLTGWRFKGMAAKGTIERTTEDGGERGTFEELKIGQESLHGYF
jgi:hypothetical protein